MAACNGDGFRAVRAGAIAELTESVLTPAVSGSTGGEAARVVDPSGDCAKGQAAGHGDRDAAGGNSTRPKLAVQAETPAVRGAGAGEAAIVIAGRRERREAESPGYRHRQRAIPRSAAKRSAIVLAPAKRRTAAREGTAVVAVGPGSSEACRIETAHGRGSPRLLSPIAQLAVAVAPPAVRDPRTHPTGMA